MAEFLTTSGISFQIENIIMKAEKELILVSPYLQISKTLHERLNDTSQRGVTIKIVYGKNDLNSHEWETLSCLSNLELYFSENLHAKCYSNEKEMVITSMNMYEFSEKNNREMGVLIKRENDKITFDDALNENHSIIKSSELKFANSKRYTHGIEKVNSGYCIRCMAEIENNPERPYCWNCYTVWSQFENPEYVERYCHSCGRHEESSMLKPQCYTCYKKVDLINTF